MTIPTYPDGDPTRALAHWINEQREEAARQNLNEYDFFGDLILSDAARVARGEPSQIPELVRSTIERFRPRDGRTSAERHAYRKQRNAELRSEAEARSGAWNIVQNLMRDPLNVSALQRLVERERQAIEAEQAQGAKRPKVAT